MLAGGFGLHPGFDGVLLGSHGSFLQGLDPLRLLRHLLLGRILESGLQRGLASSLGHGDLAPGGLQSPLAGGVADVVPHFPQLLLELFNLYHVKAKY